MYIIRTIIAMFLCGVELILVSPFMVLNKARKASGDPRRLEKREKSVRRITRWWARTILFYSGVTVTVTGLSNIPKSPCVLVGNHQGYYDIISLLGAMDKPRAFMGQSGFQKVPFLSGWMQNLDCVFVDRENAKEAMRAVQKAEKLLESGKDIYVFPEGTRSQCDSIGPFKQGAFRMATKVKCPIVPFLIDGTYKIYEKNHGWIKPAHVDITVLPPIDTAALDRVRLNQLTDEIREILLKEQAKRFAEKKGGTQQNE